MWGGIPNLQGQATTIASRKSVLRHEQRLTKVSGGGGDDFTWTNSEFQCGLPSPPYPVYGSWYNKA